MSHTPRPEKQAETGTDGIDAGVGDLLSALEDEDCRALLRAASGETLSASELSELCDLPLSTTYRKVDTLTEVGLFEEQLRLRQSGKHISEYGLRIDGIQLSLSGGCIDMETSRTDSKEGAPPTTAAGAD